MRNFLILYVFPYFTMGFMVYSTDIFDLSIPIQGLLFTVVYFTLGWCFKEVIRKIMEDNVNE